MIDSSTLGQLSGKTLTGPDGQPIGRIADVYEATDGGGGTFATVTTGLFGGGSSFFPLDAATLEGDTVTVPFSAELIKDAPRVENDEELTAPEEQRLFEYYSSTGGFRTADVEGGARGAATDSAMTRSEETLRVGTERVEAGRARLRKYVVSETETRTVPVSHEEVRVEREPITDANLDQALSGPTISEAEHEVVLTAEKPVVQKEAVPVERVRLATETVTEQVEVAEDVRKERIEVEDADAVYPSGVTEQTETHTELDVEPRK